MLNRVVMLAALFVLAGSGAARAVQFTPDACSNLIDPARKADITAAATYADDPNAVNRDAYVRAAMKYALAWTRCADTSDVGLRQLALPVAAEEYFRVVQFSARHGLPYSKILSVTEKMTKVAIELLPRSYPDYKTMQKLSVDMYDLEEHPQ